MVFKVPDKTTTIDDEYIADKYVLPFAPELVKLILDNKKTTTYRLGDKYDYLQSGDNIKIQNSVTKEIVAEAVITNKSTATFAELPISGGGHEVYADKEHQRKVLSGHYPHIGRQIDDDDLFLVLNFKLI